MAKQADQNVVLLPTTERQEIIAFRFRQFEKNDLLPAYLVWIYRLVVLTQWALGMDHQRYACYHC